MLAKDLAIKRFQSNECIAFVIALACTYLVFPLFFDAAVYPLPNNGAPWITLDPSWQLTLSKVNMDHLVWGKDFTFTYGPLSYLSTRVGWGISKYHFLVFDLFVSCNFFYIFYISYVRSRNKTITVPLILISAFLLPNFFGSGVALILSAFLIFWIRQSLDQNRAIYYLMQITLVVLLFFIKFNTGLVSVVFFSAGLIYKLIFTKENKFQLAAYFLSPFFLIPVVAMCLNVALFDYLRGGMNMVSGYNEIMYLNEPYPNEFRFSLVIMFLAAATMILKIYHEKADLWKNLVVFFLFSFPVFILYKQAFTRADIQHIMEFYKYVLLFLLCIQDFHYSESNRYSNSMMACIVFIAIFFAKRREDHLFMLKNRLTKTEYLDRVKIYTDTSGFNLFPNNNQIPQPIKDRIAQSSVDIYPWNSHLLFENKLKYTPRPVCQSYTAYTPYLENLNFEFYRSSKAPDYVLYEFEGIDYRYPLFDESKVNLTLLKNYKCIDTFQFAGLPVLVLEKNRTGLKKINLVKVKEFEIDSTTFIEPGPDSYYELHVSNTLKGKVLSVIDHSPELQLIIKTKDGNHRRYRTSRKLLETGIFSNYLFTSTRDFYHYIRKDSLNPGNEITGYRIQNFNSTLFKNKIKVVEYKVN